MLERARLGHGWANRKLERTTLLASRAVVTEVALEEARFEAQSQGEALRGAELAVATSRAQVEAARAALQRSDASRAGAAAPEVIVRAPAPYQVLRVMQQSEAPVAVGTPLVELGDPSELEVVAELLTTDAVQVGPGATVYARRWGGEQTLRGEVRRVEPSAHTKVSALGIEEQRVDVVIDPTKGGEGWSRLGDGYHLEVDVVVWFAKEVISVPVGAVVRRQGRWGVLVAGEGRARFREVKTGQRSDRDVEIERGLAEGESVILYPGESVLDGTRIQGPER